MVDVWLFEKLVELAGTSELRITATSRISTRAGCFIYPLQQFVFTQIYLPIDEVLPSRSPGNTITASLYCALLRFVRTGPEMRSSAQYHSQKMQQIRFRHFASITPAMTSPLIKEFQYNAPVARVWECLTDASQMRRWYFPQLQAFEPVVGCRFRFDDAGAAYRKEWVVTRIVPGKILAHSWSYPGHPGSSEVMFELSGDGGDTRLRVTQTGIESFPDDPHFARERFGWGWENLLGRNLRALVEGPEPAGD